MIWGFQVGENLRKQLNENTIVAYKFLKYQDLKFWIEDESIKIDALSTYVDWHPNRSTHLRRNGSTLNRHFRPQTGGLFLAFFSSSSLIFVLT